MDEERGSTSLRRCARRSRGRPGSVKVATLAARGWLPRYATDLRAEAASPHGILRAASDLLLLRCSRWEEGEGGCREKKHENSKPEAC